MTDIFLSYNREDQARAKVFAESFEAQGFSVWWDVGLRTGEAYDEVTETALRTAKAVVVLWSKKSVVSRWVRAEATLADRNKTLVPCMIEPCDRPIMFELTQTAELGHWRGDAGDKVWQAFVADVKRFVGAERSPVAAAVAGPRTPETTLAVLPFDNLSADAEMTFFSDGVSEDILGRISRGSALRVIGRTLSFQFRGAEKAKAAEALGASHVLDGSIRRAGGKVRIAAHLTEAASRSTLWSDKYDRSLEDIFAVQDEISEAIAQSLNATFFPAKTVSIDPALYDLYLKARNDRQNVLYTSANAISTLENITRLEPNFAPAWGTLAQVSASVIRTRTFAERAAERPKIEKLAATCLALDPGNIEALFALYLVLDPFGDILRQAAVIKRASVAETSDEPNWFLPFFLECVGRASEAVSVALRNGRPDARSKGNDDVELWQARGGGMNLWRAGAYAEGIAGMERTLERWPDTHDVVAALIIAYAVEGKWAAIDRLTDPLRLARYPLRELSGVIGFAKAMRDPAPEKRSRWLRHVTSLVDSTGHMEPGFSMMFTAKFGYVDEVFELIDRAKLGPSGKPTDMLGFVAYTPAPLFMVAFPELRADPRFVKLCARLGLVEYWLETQEWPDCSAEVSYDFRAECEKYRDYPKDRFFA